MKHWLSTLALLAVAAAAHGQSCYSPSYGRSYSYGHQTYAPAVTYGQTYSYAPAKKVYHEEYAPTVLRFILALPVANLPSYGAAYAPAEGVAPAAQAPQAAPQKAAPDQSLMQQISGQQAQILQAIDKLDKKVTSIDERVQRLERSREPLRQAQPAPEQGPAPKQEDDVEKAFIKANADSCAACHSRSNAQKHGGGFVFSEDDGKLAKLTAEQREVVDVQIQSGKMPRLKSKRAEEAGVKALTQQTADALFRALDRQKLAPKPKPQAAAE